MVKVVFLFSIILTSVNLIKTQEVVQNTQFGRITVFSEKATFFKAYTECNRRGMVLVHPEDINEHFNLADLMAKNDFDSLWLGAVDFVELRYFRWAKSGRSVRYYNWGQGQPNDNNHHCIIIDRVAKYKWNDQDCNSLRNFICMFF